MFATASLHPSLLAELSLSYALAGTFTSAYMLSLCAAMVPTGALGDRLGGRSLLIAGLVSMSVGSALFAVAQSYPVALISRFFVGAGAAAILVLPAPVLAFWFKKEQFRTVFGLHVSVGKTGSIVAMWVLPPLVVSLGWRLGYGVTSLVTPLALLAAFLFLVDEPRQVGLAEQGMAVSRQAGKVRERPKGEPLAKVVRNPDILLLAGGEFLLFANYFGVVNWLPTFFKTVVGTGEVEAGFQTGFILWGTVIGFAASGPLANLLGKCRPLFSAGTAATALLTLVFATGSLPALPAWTWPSIMFTYGLCLSVMVLIQPILATLVPVRSLGTANGFVFMVSYMGAMISPPVMGAVADATGSLTACFWVAVVCAAASFVTSLFIREGTARA